MVTAYFVLHLYYFGVDIVFHLCRVCVPNKIPLASLILFRDLFTELWDRAVNNYSLCLFFQNILA